MMSANSETFTEITQTEVSTIQEAMASAYGAPRLLWEVDLPNMPTLVVGDEDAQQTLERVTDRQYSIVRANDHYSMSLADLDELEQDVSYMLPPETEYAGVSRKLFIGLGVASTVIREVSAAVKVSESKREEHFNFMKEFYGSHLGIEEGLLAVFSDVETMARSFAMAERLTDERAMTINGLRLRIGMLLDAPGMEGFVGVSRYTMAEYARVAIQKRYEREAATLYRYCCVWTWANRRCR